MDGDKGAHLSGHSGWVWNTAIIARASSPHEQRGYIDIPHLYAVDYGSTISVPFIPSPVALLKWGVQ
jgi:hypothetical protein